MIQPIIIPAQTMPKFVVDKYRLGLFNNGGIARTHVKTAENTEQASEKPKTA